MTLSLIIINHNGSMNHFLISHSSAYLRVKQVVLRVSTISNCLWFFSVNTVHDIINFVLNLLYCVQ